MLLAAVGACILIAACRPPLPPRDLQVEWTIAPAPATVGPATLVLTLRSADGHPETGASLRVEAQMSHPGMAPESAAFREVGGGRYDAVVPLTMAGDWTLLIRGSLSNGTPVEHRIDVAPVRPE